MRSTPDWYTLYYFEPDYQAGESSGGREPNDAFLQPIPQANEDVFRNGGAVVSALDMVAVYFATW